MITKNRFGILVLFSAILLALSFIIRTVLVFKSLLYLDASVPLMVRIYGVGLFYDLVTLSYASVPVVLYLMLVPDRMFRSTINQRLLIAGFFAATAALIFGAAAEYLFFDEFGARFNFIAIDYLIYTREVIGNIRESYPVTALFSGILAAAGALVALLRKPITGALRSPDLGLRRFAYGAVLLAVPVLAFFFVDLSLTNISDNSYADELAGNGIYDLGAAFRNSQLDYGRFYPTEDESSVMARLRGLLKEKNNRLVSGDVQSIMREITGKGGEKRLNVIIVVEESLSAEYLKAFGSPFGLTPNLDALADQSLLFTHLYATGTRTVRGLEAITLSLPPLPGTSLIKRKENGGYFSWGTVMRSKGYDTKFLYAGYGYFDDMSSFFSGNGFAVVDRSDFMDDEITFSNTWGVSDEDLFRKVVREAGRSHARGKPFFSMVMTTSNHRPFTYPEGRVSIPPGRYREGGVQYADYAVGRFLDEAKKQPWFDDTLFVFVADHCAGSAGKTELPVKRYEIPLIIYAPKHVQPGKVDVLASQIDVAPTVLGLLNFSYRTAFFGKDLLKMDPSQARAFISTYQKLGFIRNDELLIMGPGHTVQGYVFDRSDGSVRAAQPPAEDIADMISYYQGTDAVVRYGKNRVR